MSGTVLLGLDVGGSSIKGGLVDVEAGRVVGELQSVPTPQPATPDAVLDAIAGFAATMPSTGPVGFAFPSVVQHGIARTAAHVDRAWLGVDGAARLGERLGRPVAFLNDADAAGLAEMTWGAGQGADGVVMLLTLGTGIGTALFVDGTMVPNLELGHVEMASCGREIEDYAAARIRTELSLDFPAWVGRVNEVLAYLHRLFWPDVFILGGSVTERYAEFQPLLRAPCEIRPARFAAQAGVAGAALAASRLH